MQAGEVFVPVTVVLELEWVLRSRYGFAPQQVARAMEMLAGLPGVNLHEADAVRVAARRAAKGWDFADALHHGGICWTTRGSRATKARAARSH